MYDINKPEGIDPIIIKGPAETDQRVPQEVLEDGLIDLHDRYIDYPDEDEPIDVEESPRETNDWLNDVFSKRSAESILELCSGSESFIKNKNGDLVTYTPESVDRIAVSESEAEFDDDDLIIDLSNRGYTETSGVKVFTEPFEPGGIVILDSLPEFVPPDPNQFKLVYKKHTIVGPTVTSDTISHLANPVETLTLMLDNYNPIYCLGYELVNFEGPLRAFSMFFNYEYGYAEYMDHQDPYPQNIPSLSYYIKRNTSGQEEFKPIFNVYMAWMHNPSHSQVLDTFLACPIQLINDAVYTNIDYNSREGFIISFDIDFWEVGILPDYIYDPGLPSSEGHMYYPISLNPPMISNFSVSGGLASNVEFTQYYLHSELPYGNKFSCTMHMWDTDLMLSWNNGRYDEVRNAIRNWLKKQRLPVTFAKKDLFDYDTGEDYNVNCYYDVPAQPLSVPGETAMSTTLDLSPYINTLYPTTVSFAGFTSGEESLPTRVWIDDWSLDLEAKTFRYTVRNSGPDTAQITSNNLVFKMGYIGENRTYDGNMSLDVRFNPSSTADPRNVIHKGEPVSKEDLTPGNGYWLMKSNNENGDYILINETSVNEVFEHELNLTGVTKEDTFGVLDVEENGVYNASSDNVDAYNQVVVNVPRAFSTGSSKVVDSSNIDFFDLINPHGE